MKNIHFKSSRTFENLSIKYKMIDDLWEGTDAMRREGTTYLPREPKETVKNYNLRLDRAVLEPIMKRVIMQSVGKAFSKHTSINDIPPSIEPIVYNADQTGTSLEAFSKELLTDAIKYGITYILSDFPVTTPNATLADEIEAGAYPYMVNIKPTQVLDLHVGYITGTAQLTYFRFLEQVIEYDANFQSQYINQVKEFTFDDEGNVIFNIYRLNDKDQEYLYDSNMIRNMTRIPISPVYANKTSPFVGEPTLMDLAHMNILHYQKSTDVDVALHYGAMPMLVLKGYDSNIDPNTGAEDEIVISPNSGIKVSETGDVRWLELSGSGISTYMENIKELKASMSMLGLELTSPKSIHETATGKLLDEHTKNSILKVITIDLKSALEKALYFAGQYIQEDVDADVVIDTSLTVALDDGVDNIISMVKEGILTPSDGLNEVKARMLLLTDPTGNTNNNEDET